MFMAAPRWSCSPWSPDRCSQHTQTPGVHNGVVTACVEPATKANKATSGDLNVLACLKGATKISWSITGPEEQGQQGQQVRTEAKAPQARRATQVLRGLLVTRGTGCWAGVAARVRWGLPVCQARRATRATRAPHGSG